MPSSLHSKYHSVQLSALISDTSVKHHIYADDTQLVISFTYTDLSFQISNSTIDIVSTDIVSTWFSANLLSLNQSQTEIILIGLPKQLTKIS